MLATSAFLLGIPYALALGQEQEIIEQEKRQGMMTEGASGLLLPGEAAGEVKQWLQANGISVWVSVCSSTRIDMEQRGLEELVRASVHYYNTEAEIDRFCTTLAATSCSED